MFACPDCENEIEHVFISEASVARIIEDTDGKHYIKTTGSEGVSISCPDCKSEIHEVFDLMNSEY